MRWARTNDAMRMTKVKAKKSLRSPSSFSGNRKSKESWKMNNKVKTRKEIEKITKRKTGVIVEEVSVPENSAILVAKNIAEQIEKRIPYRRAVKQAIENVMKVGVRGIRVRVSGRLNGAEIARNEKFFQGKIPLSTFRENIDFARIPANTTYGVIGIKVWIYRKEEEAKKIKKTDQ